MDVKTARKYLRARRLPSEMKAERHWRTRHDGFAEVWSEIQEQLRTNPGLEAKTIFAALQRQYPERFADGQLRTLQRRIKQWRATEGPAHEVYFVQEHRPGELCESDFTHLTELAVTIGGQPFPTYAVPLCADVLELGDGNDLSVGELRQSERRPAKRALGTGWQYRGCIARTA